MLRCHNFSSSSTNRCSRESKIRTLYRCASAHEGPLAQKSATNYTPVWCSSADLSLSDFFDFLDNSLQFHVFFRKRFYSINIFKTVQRKSETTTQSEIWNLHSRTFCSYSRLKVLFYLISIRVGPLSQHSLGVLALVTVIEYRIPTLKYFIIVDTDSCHYT